MFGLEEYYRDLLEEAKSLDDIEKILHYQFVQGKNVPEKVFYTIFSADPTKRKVYTRWILSHWEREKEEIINMVKNNSLKRFFDYFKSRERNGLNLANLPSIRAAIELLPNFDPVLGKNGNNGPEDEYEIKYDSPEWKVAVPFTYEASKKLGKGCEWCTAEGYGNRSTHFDNYTSQGPLWINFDMRSSEICPMDNKEYPYTRYQFCFETNDFMDSHDKKICVSDIGMPKEVYSFYEKQNEDYAKILERAGMSDDERMEVYDEERNEHSTCIKQYENNYLDLKPEYNRDYEFNEDCEYYLYDSEYDDIDPVSYVVIDREHPIYKDYEESSIIILNTTGNNKAIAFNISEDNERYVTPWTVLDSVDSFNEIGEYLVVNNFGLKIFIFNTLTNEVFTQETKEVIHELDSRLGIPIENSNESLLNDKIFITARLKSGSKSLVSFDTKTREFKTIIKKDFPIDYDFMASQENGSFVIRCKYFAYPLNTDVNGINDVSNVFDNYTAIYMHGDGVHLIMKMDTSEDSDTLVNIYNTQTKKMLLDKPAKGLSKAHINDLAYVVSYSKFEHYLLSLKADKIVSKAYANLIPKSGNIGNSVFFGFGPLDDRSAGFDILSEDGGLFKHEDNIVCISDYRFYITQEGELFKFYTFEFQPMFNGKSFKKVSLIDKYNFELKTLGGMRSDYASDEHHILLTKDDNTFCIFDASKYKIEIDNILSYKYYDAYDVVVFNLSTTEKLVCAHVGIHEKDFSNIIYADVILDDTLSLSRFGYINDGRIYIYNWLDKKMILNGLDSSLVSRISVWGYDNQITIETNNGSRINFYSGYDDGKVKITSYMNTNHMNDEQFRNMELNKLFGNSAIMKLQENFNSFLKRLNNVRF